MAFAAARMIKDKAEKAEKAEKDLKQKKSAEGGEGLAVKQRAKVINTKTLFYYDIMQLR